MKRNFIGVLQSKSVRFLLLTLFSALGSTCSAQAQTYEAFVEKRVSEIRAEVNAINRNAVKHTKTTRNVEGVSLEGTEATYYRSSKDLKKITAKIYGETYISTAELYYKNGELLFAFLKRGEYDMPIGTGASPRVVRTEERRFYFRSDGELIRLLVGREELKPSDERYPELKDEIISLSSKLKDS